VNDSVRGPDCPVPPWSRTVEEPRGVRGFFHFREWVCIKRKGQAMVVTNLALTTALLSREVRGHAVLKPTFAELLRSCSPNISPPCCLACVTRVAGRSMRLPLSFIRVSRPGWAHELQVHTK
jgi:hypothetical protein